MPWWTRTGRNQPSGRGLAYFLSLPAWVHGVICPPEGYGIACLDWVAQEFGLGAGSSGCPAMIADFQSGDPHLGLAILGTGLAPEGATKASHGAIRKTIKPVSLDPDTGSQSTASLDRPVNRGAGLVRFWRLYAINIGSILNGRPAS